MDAALARLFFTPAGSPPRRVLLRRLIADMPGYAPMLQAVVDGRLTPTQEDEQLWALFARACGNHAPTMADLLHNQLPAATTSRRPVRVYVADVPGRFLAQQQ